MMQDAPMPAQKSAETVAPAEEPTPTIALCMIVRDVGPYIEKCLASLVDVVDVLSIVDTGSKDDTLTVIQDVVDMRMSHGKPFKYILNHFTPETNPESFLHDVKESYEGIEGAPPHDSLSGQLLLADYAKARQISFDAADTEYRMWIDSDDIVIGAGNIPAILRKMQKDGIESALMTYDYEEDDEGRLVNTLLRTRILKNGSEAKWGNPIHESIGPLGKTDVIESDYIRIVHQAKKLGAKQTHRVPLRNYKVLVWRIHNYTKASEAFHPRLWFYLGNEIRPYQPERAMTYLKKYIELGDWDEEKSLAHIYVGQLHEGKGEMEEAQANYATASTIFPKPECFFGLSRIRYYKQEWAECVRQHEKGRTALHEVRDVLHCNPLDRYYYPAIIASRAYLEVGHLRKALKIADEGLKYAPKDLNLIGVKKRVEALLAKNQRRLDIVIHTGKSLETWNADTPRTTGIGGSETAAAMIARSLVRRGHRVRLYCHCEGKEGNFEGVEYIPYDQFDGDAIGMVDAFITSRRVYTLHENKIKARLKILWMHDTGIGAPTIPVSSGLLMCDLIFCVSKWHKSLTENLYPFVPPENIVATRNGIDPTLFMPDVKPEDLPPKKNKLIYSSSFDRGLDLAIKLFPFVRTAVPDAELHVFYGFDTVDKMIERMPPEKAKDIQKKIDDVKALAAATPGVVLRGRVSQAQLAMEMLEAKGLFYPTEFQETSCITVMEAQAAACPPITTELAALTESVHRGFLFKPPTANVEYQRAIVGRAVACLTNDKIRHPWALVGRKDALAFHPWDNVAKEWEDILCDALARRS